MRIDLERLTSNDDTFARCRLSGNRDIRSTNIDGRLQANDAADIEHHDTGTALFAGPTERTRTVVVQIGNGEHLTTSSAKSEHTTAFSTRECWYLRLAQVVGTSCPGNVRTSLFGLFDNNRECHFPSGVGMSLPLCFLFSDKLLGLIGEVGILCTGCHTYETCHSHQKYFLHIDMS